MSAVVVDASVWISSLIVQDVNHVISRRWRRAWLAGSGTFALPLLIVAEIAGALTRRTGQQRFGDRAVATILGNPAITLVAVDHSLATLAAQHASRFSLRGSDAVYTALADQLGIPLITWDNEQLTRTGGRVQVSQPTL